jgi:hypothetical protein
MSFKEAFKEEIADWARYLLAALIAAVVGLFIVGALYLANRYFGFGGGLGFLVLLVLVGRVMQRRGGSVNG